MSNKRYEVLDSIRGIVLISMILYHGVWDMVYIFHVRWDWYRSDLARLWQQSICWSFILLSGFCWSLGKRQLRRGLIVLGAGTLVSLVTCIFMPDNAVIFGVLTFLGSAMILTVPLDKYLRKWKPLWGIVLTLALFMFTRGINDRFLGFGHWSVIKLPDSWYANLATTFLGFRMRGFYSTDYFSMMPWFFLFLTGYFVHKLAVKKGWMPNLGVSRLRPMAWLGRHSLLIYLLHQPVIYGLLYVFFKIVK